MKIHVDHVCGYAFGLVVEHGSALRCKATSHLEVHELVPFMPEKRLETTLKKCRPRLCPCSRTHGEALKSLDDLEVAQSQATSHPEVHEPVPFMPEKDSKQNSKNVDLVCGPAFGLVVRP